MALFGDRAQACPSVPNQTLGTPGETVPRAPPLNRGHWARSIARRFGGSDPGPAPRHGQARPGNEGTTLGTVGTLPGLVVERTPNGLIVRRPSPAERRRLRPARWGEQADPKDSRGTPGLPPPDEGKASSGVSASFRALALTPPAAF